MKITDFFKTYNFHDSLLENVVYKADLKEVSFEIDFCYWMQDSFKEGDKENGLIKILFTGVSEFQYEKYEICSDSILSFVITDDETIELTVETDNGDIHSFSFKSSEADFLTKL